MLDRTAVGRKASPTLHEVEKGAIRRFAEAIGETNQVFFDDAAAKAAGYKALPAPAAFFFSFTNGQDLRELLGVPLRSLLLAELSWEIERSMVVGDRLMVSARIAEVTERPGPAGPVEMAIIEDEGRDVEGLLVYRGKRTYVFRPAREM